MAETPNTDHVLQLAMFMQRRDAMQFGVVKDGEVTPSWEDSGLAQHEYIADAEVMLRAVATLDYGPIAEVQAECDAALAVIEQTRALRDEWDTAGRLRVLARDANAVLDGLDDILCDTPASALATVKADAWDEGIQAGYDHSANQSTPSGIPIDPPANPYREEATGD